jgi:hypothetical protein
MAVARNVVYLVSVNTLWTRARLGDMQEMGFGLREILLIEDPPPELLSGFAVGAAHVQYGWRGRLNLSRM